MRKWSTLVEIKTLIPTVMVRNLILFLANVLFGTLFLPAPVLKMDEGKRKDFEEIYEGLESRENPKEMDYRCLYPKVDFLCYLALEKDVLFHGSKRFGMEELQPKKQTDWNGRLMEAVFASGDGIWPLFFAIIDQQQYRGLLRNGCFVIEGDGSLSVIISFP